MLVLRALTGASLNAQQGEITLLLDRWKEGEMTAFDQLVPLVYPHLREVAAAYIRRERNPGVMQATSLVHELYLRLLMQKKADWGDRSHFYTFSAKIMRMILIDHARATQAQCRGSQAEHVPLSDAIPWIGLDSIEMIELDRALEEFALLDPVKVQLIELRFFLGCTAEETADLMNISKATVDRDIKFARTWLFRRIHPEASSPAPE